MILKIEAAMFGIGNFFRRLRHALRHSAHFHIVERNITQPQDLIDLIDRFVDGPMRYPLEWDDFISWENSNSSLEAVRLRIGDAEPLLFSGDAAKKKRYVEIIITERNKLAGIIGSASRSTN